MIIMKSYVVLVFFTKYNIKRGMRDMGMLLGSELLTWLYLLPETSCHRLVWYSYDWRPSPQCTILCLPKRWCATNPSKLTFGRCRSFGMSSMSSWDGIWGSQTAVDQWWRREWATNHLISHSTIPSCPIDQFWRGSNCCAKARWTCKWGCSVPLLYFPQDRAFLTDSSDLIMV